MNRSPTWVAAATALLLATVATAQRGAPVLHRTTTIPDANFDEGRRGPPGQRFGRASIMLTGYWPPSNEAVRRFSQSAEQNPQGWIGEDWENRGYDVHAFFPEFEPSNCQQCSRGRGQLRVDYQDTSRDFWALVETIKPIAIITFSRGFNDRSWELEMNQYNRTDWTNDFALPLVPTPNPPDASAPAGHLRNSSLPVQDIVSAIAAANLNVVPSICFSGDGGGFVSEFIAYHGVWYRSLHASPADPNWCVAAGHVHIGGKIGWQLAAQATEVTLRTVIAHVDRVRATKVCQPDLGFTGPGATRLTACGDPAASGGRVDLLLRNAPPQAPAVLLAGTAFAPTPFLGGTIVPLPAKIELPVTVGTDGRVLLRNIRGGGGPATWYAQYVYLDARQAFGIGISNTVQLDFLP